MMMELTSPLSSSDIGIKIFEPIPCGMFLMTRIELSCFENIAFGGFCNIVPSSKSEYTFEIQMKFFDVQRKSTSVQLKSGAEQMRMVTNF